MLQNRNFRNGFELKPKIRKAWFNFLCAVGNPIRKTFSIQNYPWEGRAVGEKHNRETHGHKCDSCQNECDRFQVIFHFFNLRSRGAHNAYGSGEPNRSLGESSPDELGDVARTC